MALAVNDRVSGDGPRNVNRKNQLMDGGWRPNSIRVGDAWYPYPNWGPLGLGLAIVGNAHDAAKYNEIKGDDWSSRVAATVAGTSATIFDMSFLSGVNDFMETVKSEDPKKLERFATRTATSFVDPNFFKQVGRIFDPTVYEPRNVFERILTDMRITYGARPRLNVFGEPVVADRLTQFSPSAESKDPVTRFLADRQLWVSVPAKTTQIRLGGKEVRPMTEDEYYEYVQRSGPIVKEQLERRMDLIGRQGTREKQQDAVNEVVRNAREGVRNDIARRARAEGGKKE